MGLAENFKSYRSVTPRYGVLAAIYRLKISLVIAEIDGKRYGTSEALYRIEISIFIAEIDAQGWGGRVKTIDF